MTITERPAVHRDQCARVPADPARREALRDLARDWQDRLTWRQQLMFWAYRQERKLWKQQALILGELVHGSMSERLAKRCTCGICLTCSWDAYRWDLALAEGLEGEPGATPYTPDDIGEGLGFDQARDEIWMRVAGLEDLLLRGVGAR